MSADNRPYFSILIPSYNRPDNVVECVKSVLANENEDFEILISDDASPQSDAIAAAVRPFLGTVNVRFHSQPANLGEPANRNYLVSQATGTYNIILCDDDTIFPDTLRKLKTAIKRHPDHDVYLFGYRVVDEQGVQCYDRVSPRGVTIDLNHPRLTRRMFQATWLSFLLFHQGTFCCRREIEREIGYRSEVAPADDYMFLLECLHDGKRLFVVPEVLMSYRWCLSNSEDKQVNQSSNIVRTMAASTSIYYAFQRRRDLHPLVADIVRGTAFRRRFLYDVIIRRMCLSDESIGRLRLQPEHRDEFVAYHARCSRRTVLVTVALQVMAELFQEFGFKGMICWIRAAMAYVRYRAFRTSNGRPMLMPCGFLSDRG